MRGYPLLVIVLFSVLCVLFRFLPAHLPSEIRIWVIPPLMGFALFCGARLSWALGAACLFTSALVGDVLLYISRGWEPVPIVYLCLALNLLLGKTLVGGASNRNWFRIFGTGGLATLLFFLVTNFASWAAKALPEYEPTFSGLMYAYRKGLEFLRDYPGSTLSELVWFPAMIWTYDWVMNVALDTEKVESKV